MLILCDFLPTQEHPAQFYFPGEALAPITLEDILAAAPPLQPGQAGWMVQWGYVWSEIPGVQVHAEGRPYEHFAGSRERMWSYIPIIGPGYVPPVPSLPALSAMYYDRAAQAYSISRLRERPPEPTHGEPRPSHAGREWEDVAEGGRLMAQQVYWSVFPGREPCWLDGYGNWPFEVENWGRIELLSAARMAA